MIFGMANKKKELIRFTAFCIMWIPIIGMFALPDECKLWKYIFYDDIRLGVLNAFYQWTWVVSFIVYTLCKLTL